MKTQISQSNTEGNMYDGGPRYVYAEQMQHILSSIC